MEEKEKRQQENSQDDTFQEKVENAVSGILKIKKAFAIGIAAALLIASLITGGAAIYANVDLAGYSNNAQVEEIAQAIDCDTSYITQKNNKYARMEHNGSKPIYVCFDEALTEEEKASATRSLDYLFGIVGEINPFYRYEIVNKATFDKQKSKTKIYYTLGSRHIESGNKSADYEGFISRSYNWLSFLTTKRTMNEFTISIDRDLAADNLDYVYLHELFHAFGADDVFTILTTPFSSKHQGNTFLQSQIGNDVPLPTPNDMKCLLALYAPKFDNEEEKNSFLTRYESMLEEYEEVYYDQYSLYCKDTYGDGELQQGNLSYSKTTYYTAHPELNHTHKITITGDKYLFEIYDKEKQLLDSASGDVVWVNGVAILRDVSFKEGLRPGHSKESFSDGYIQDLALVKKGISSALVDLKTNSAHLGRLTYSETAAQDDNTIEQQ